MKKYILNILFVIALCFGNYSRSYADGLDDDILGYFNSKPNFIDQENVNLVSKAIKLIYGNASEIEKTTYFSIAKQLSDQGYAIGDWFLGFCYEAEEGCEFNPELAFKYHLKAATAEIPFCRALRSVGYCYAYGVGTLSNKEESFKWFKKATETIHLDTYIASSL